jgi:hypothetical protein
VTTTKRHRRRVVVAAATLLLIGGFLFFGPLSPARSGTELSAWALRKPVCDGLLSLAQATDAVGSAAWTWQESDPDKLTDYSCKLAGWRLAVAPFPGPTGYLGGLVGKVDLDTPLPLGNGLAGTTSESFSWLAMNCNAAKGADQLLVSLDVGGTEKAVRLLYEFAAAVARRQGCTLPRVVHPVRLPAVPAPRPVSATETLCGLVPATTAGRLDGWVTQRSPAPRDPVDDCLVEKKPHSLMTRDEMDSWMSITTFRGPFIGPHADRLDFYSYPIVCRGPGAIYALRLGRPSAQGEFTNAFHAAMAGRNAHCFKDF